MKVMVRKVLATPFLHGLRRMLGRKAAPSPRWRKGQQGPDYYDQIFDENDNWRLHYTRSPYYIIWTVIIDRLRRRKARRVLEIGCGTGQLATAIRDADIVKEYCGFDFSPKRLSQARMVCPQFHFEVADAFETNLIETREYDTVVATEFLEHVEGDISIIKRIRAGTRVLATVPNFPFVSHVRHFQDASEVVARYGSLFEDFSVATIMANEKGKVFFLLEGDRTG